MILGVGKSRWQLWIEAEIDFESKEITLVGMDRDNHERPGAKDEVIRRLGVLCVRQSSVMRMLSFPYSPSPIDRSPTLTP